MHKLGATQLFENLREDDARVRERRERWSAWLDLVGPLGWAEASARSGVSEGDAARWIRIFPDFAAEYRAIAPAMVVRLERIVEDIGSGAVVANRDQLAALTLRLKALAPEVYRERSSVDVRAAIAIAAVGSDSRARLMLAEWSA